MRNPLFLFIIATTASACGAVADTDYRGEPLVKIRGNVVTMIAALTLPQLEVSVIWTHEDEDGDGDALTAQSVTVDGSFPAAFELTLFEPPPPAVLSIDETDGNAFVMGLIVAASSGTDPYSIDHATTPVGAVVDHAVIWTRNGFAEGSREALYFGANALAAGYHLMKVISPEERLALNPNLAACLDVDFYENCTEPADDSEAAWRVYAECSADAQIAAGCWGPEAWQAALVPAPAGFETQLSLELVENGDAMAWPELQ